MSHDEIELLSAIASMENRVPSIAKGQRILAAIMITDAVGFSARMSADEETTLQMIDRDLNLIAQLCDEHDGNLLKTTGDGLLMYFVSAVHAVSCGLEIQRQLVEFAKDRPETDYLDHRIGIHLGDILVSQADVMGNGVNIAARLQTYAKPRGLCISQTIYDVVKARLTLHSTFLGPLKLKNIREAVPAYQVHLDPVADLAEANTSGQEDATCMGPVTPELLLTTTIKEFDRHQHSQRIKKLVFALYHQAWENDPTVLAQFDLADMLIALRQRYPTTAALKAQLIHIVAGLNRKAVYLAVVDILVNELAPWYEQSATTIPGQEETGLIVTPSGEQTCTAIAETLAALPEHQRAHKLLYCICQNAWTNDPQVLHQWPLPELVQQTYDVAPTVKNLKYQLSRIIKRLNRKADYTRLANQIIASFQPLYAQDQEATHLSPPDECSDSGPQTSMTCLEPPSPATVAEMTTLHTSLSNPGVLPDGKTLPPSPTVQPTVRDRSNLFELRLDIMRYTNPLRAKILLYSCLHGPFSFSHQDWLSLRAQNLDNLLDKVFDYCQSFSDLESKLTIISHCLDNADENAQVASAIAAAMRAYYPINHTSDDDGQSPAGNAQGGKRSSAAPASPPSKPINSTALLPAY